MSYKDPTEIDAGGFLALLVFCIVMYIIYEFISGLISQIPPIWLYVAIIVFIIGFIYLIIRLNKTKLERKLKSLLKSHQDMLDKMDSRIWWSIEVSIPDSLYGGSDTDYWTCDVNIASSDEETAKRKAIDLVRKRNHSYDDMRKKMERIFNKGTESFNKTLNTLVWKGPFRTFEPIKISGELYFKICDFTEIVKEIANLEKQIEEKQNNKPKEAKLS